MPAGGAEFFAAIPKGNIRYVVYSSVRRDGDYDGVRVYWNQRQIADVLCADNRVNDTSCLGD